MEPRRVAEKGNAYHCLPDHVSLMVTKMVHVGKVWNNPPGHHRQRQWRPAEWSDDSKEGASNFCHVFQSSWSLEDTVAKNAFHLWSQIDASILKSQVIGTKNKADALQAGRLRVDVVCWPKVWCPRNHDVSIPLCCYRGGQTPKGLSTRAQLWMNNFKRPNPLNTP